VYSVLIRKSPRKQDDSTMVSPSVDNRVQEETTKSHPRRQDNMHGRKEEEKKLKRGKRNTNIKAKGKCKSNASQSPALNTQEICCCSDRRERLKTTLGYLETHLSAIHPPSSKMTVAATGNTYLSAATLFLKGVQIVLLFLQSDLHLLWCRHRCLFPVSRKNTTGNYNFPSFLEYLISCLFFCIIGA
jgi:hypothetical protein